MKKVFLKYNPYKLETEITIDGKSLAENSVLGECLNDARLQDWIEDFPSILVEESNDREFEIDFHGTLLDYEDLTSAFNDVKDITVKLNQIPAKETPDKEGLIEEVFQKIIGDSCPFNELREDEQIKNAFDLAMGDNFEVCVVATMSAGKSTLINAMLGSKLMPSKQEACTAIITRIKDEDCSDFRAVVYDKNKKCLETHEHLTYDTMVRLNNDEDVSEIHVSGKIPFVAIEEATQKKEISLVLIDTPGPNNARDPRHGETQRELLGKSSKALVLYVMTGEFGTDDDNMLLKRVAESMTVKGKQSKDRFIFVVNKLDGRKKEDGSIEQTLERVRGYLKRHGISKPNLFPAAALPALNIRLMRESYLDMDEDDRYETEYIIKKLNRNEELHFEKWAALPPSVRDEINNNLVKKQNAWKKEKNENPEEALIHSGVISVEAAIRQYVQKYAKTAKIKNIVDTFKCRVDALACEEQAVLAITNSEEECKQITEQITQIQVKLDSANEAKRFKEAVDNSVEQINKKSKEIAENIVAKFQEKITKKIDNARNRKFTENEVNDEVERLIRFAKILEPDFKDDLQELLTENLVTTGNTLIDEYKKKITMLNEEIGSENITGFKLDPLELMSDRIPSHFSVEDLFKEKTNIKETLIENTNKAWYKPWTWLEDDVLVEKEEVTEKYVLADELAQKFFKPIQESILENKDLAEQNAKRNSEKIAAYFNNKFNELDAILAKKLSDLKSLGANREEAEKRAEAARKNKAWLDDILAQVESIVEI